MKIIPVLAAFALVRFTVVITHSHHMHLLSDEFIDHINSKQKLWRAGRNFPRDTPISYLKKLAGAQNLSPTSGYAGNIFGKPPRSKHRFSLATNFDSRDKWRKCNYTLSDIRDQGGCGSCWAMSAASAMTDRLCIQFEENHYFSEFDIMCCCMDCGSPCGGSKNRDAWIYGNIYGIVTGGKFGSHQGCKPYKYPSCTHTLENYHDKCKIFIPSTECDKKCEKGYKKLYKQDQRKLALIYNMSDISQIMLDIQKRGPVTTTFAVHEDFYSYKNGVYRHVSGKKMGFHSVKIIGWGTEGSIPYWLAANSWNPNWGNKGFFKIIRGINHLGIEQVMYSGLFKKKRKDSTRKFTLGGQ